jgi:hypothetical protein
MNRQRPTPEEMLALQKIKGIHARTLVAVFAVGALAFTLRALPERYAAASVIASIGLVLYIVAVLIYRACFLKCPRCSKWIVIAKCPHCGLKLDEHAIRRGSADNR